MNTYAEVLQSLTDQRQALRMPGFLSVASCEALIDASRQAAHFPAQTSEASMQYRRQTRLVDLPESAFAEVARQLDAQAETICAFFGLPLVKREKLQMFHYQSGDFFKPHYDKNVHPGAPADPLYAKREISVVIFLNAHQEVGTLPGFQGGRFSFFLPRGPLQPYMGVPIMPEAGMLLAFRSDLLHEVNEVKAGERFSLVSWLTR